VTIRYTRRALFEIAEILEYLHERNPLAAAEVSKRLDSVVGRLRQFPNTGRLVAGVQVRVTPLGRYPYLVFFAVNGNDVQILHVRHGARLWPTFHEK
jgi:toxin ParE1/3/4